ncbi:MAG: IgA Peptidase M64 [Bacteroidales bacterium]|nr:IgA Peptidase M64 [Bacteroidales bacterium]
MRNSIIKSLTIIALMMAGISALASSPANDADGALDLTRTLRLNYIFSGTAESQEIALSELCSIEGWAGRRVNMGKSRFKGNGDITVLARSQEDGPFDRIVYVNSFSTLFQEWQTTEEATKVRRSFENVFLVPMPAEEVAIQVRLFDFHGNVACEHIQSFTPGDILVRPTGKVPSPHEWIWKGGESLDSPARSEERIDIAMVAEGYTDAEMDIFMNDCREAMESLWAHEPFGGMRDRFNIVAVKLPSKDSGVSVPGAGDWKDTPVGSHFNTFYSDRYLTTPNVFKLHDALAGIPYEHIIILANTDTYGGGGIFNSYTLTTAHHTGFRPVVVHEFGHSFAGLADEYYYDDGYSPYYFPDAEPWEDNITTRKEFRAKWKKLVGSKEDLHVHDEWTWKGREEVSGKVRIGLNEGGGYLSKGVWRACEDCRMKTNSYPAFCPVCQHSILETILYYTEERNQ